MITQKTIKETLKYKNGILLWKNPTGKRTKIGSKAGSPNTKGYLQTRIMGKKYLNHRLIFLLFNGWMPKYIDHIDNNKSNNKIENLRCVTQSQNMRNSKLSKANTSGFKGVYWIKKRKNWRAQIMSKGKYICIGFFDSAKKANQALEVKRLELHGEYANHG